MRRLRSLSEAECYARCYGEWEGAVRVVRPSRPAVPDASLLAGEALRRRFEEYLDAREPDAVAEPEAA